jgi:predicted transcriptional regulator
MKLRVWLIIPTFYKQAYSVCVKGCSCIKVISIIDVLSATSDERSLLLFRTIARFNSEGSTTEILINTLHLRSKQYYSRMSELVKADLVTRKDGKYFLTSFGKLVYDAQTTIEKALANYWKLKAIDRLENSHSDPIPREEHDEIIHLLIDNEGIKEQIIIEKHPITNKVFPDRCFQEISRLSKSDM